MFVGVTSEENWYKENKPLNKTETEPISTRSVMQLTMTKGAHSRDNRFVTKCADRSRCRLHYTHQPFV
jgi:hypothetical protein